MILFCFGLCFVLLVLVCCAVLCFAAAGNRAQTEDRETVCASYQQLAVAFTFTVTSQSRAALLAALLAVAVLFIVYLFVTYI